MTCREIEQAGGTARWLSADVTAADAPRAIVARALADFGRLDAVVNAAGIISSGAVHETSDEGWDAMLDVNVRAPFRLIREATPALVDAARRRRQRLERRRARGRFRVSPPTA